ncbi:beta transducin-like protein HET-E2C*40 [Glonium stellatum]|uniref:Beta transducin-like protein HET-E2C*40 n=1 Tax=Glonium stellatum TaxID=574774 RepID=A0A8E2JP13_9PEZI|nr:beta transducin-like protein HET-E2C*40 [Glonium stellatum]
MRLLLRSETGEFSLTKVDDDLIPPYAILSHSWGSDNEEVTFEDIINGTGKKKPGYKKILFCEKQARQNNLNYFWVDTCCIDKENKAELAQAINSMFYWYRNAAQCYVYLSDVSSPSVDWPWELDFRKSRWFTRGWTLQELLAPASVKFFSRERKRLGDKSSLEQQIYEITGIPRSALQGDLSQFSVNEKLSWIEARQTKLEEDKAYSLLGIFGVYIAPLYGEGMANAFSRLQKEIDKRERCIQDLRLTDPGDDKKRIEDTKGGLLEGLYRWIFENSDFQQWRSAQQTRLLWIKGDPGKGKTMLLCGIINELKKSIAKSDLLSYFFCQATDSRVNNATAVLRGLIYLLVSQQPSLISHVRKKYDNSGKTLFKDANAWIALSEIFTNILQDRSLNSTYLIIDALDECVVDLPKLLDFIVQKSSVSSRIKWIVSSRNWPSIEKKLDTATQKARLCLEFNKESVSAAVATFIKLKVDWLAKRNKYDSNTQDAVQRYLSLNANGTFLWVALVCQELSTDLGWNAQQKLNAFPPGLNDLYWRMVDQIKNSEHAELCKRILAVISTVYRPIMLDELASFVDMPDGVAGGYKALSEIIGVCGSFLTLREQAISFVHQSAKDFLVEKAPNEIYPSGIEYVHLDIFSRSLQVMSKKLRRDVYGLGAPGFPIDQVKQPDSDPLSPARYSCIYWINHLLDCNPTKNATNDLQDGGSVDKFLRQSYLYWLEALSLYRSMSEGVVSGLLKPVKAKANGSGLLELVKDACRFIMYHKVAIENSPLQGYTSVLIFSPACSLIRGHFRHEEPKWITIQPAMRDEWSACLQTLEGHSDWVWSVAFSHDSTRLASASDDGIVKIWNASSGKCLQTLKGHSGMVRSVAFSHDSTRLASASDDGIVKIWDASSGKSLQTLKGRSDRDFSSIAFSHDLTRLASTSTSDYGTVKIWDTSNGKCLQTLRGDRHWDISSVAFSHDSTRLASTSDYGTIKIWDASSGKCLRTLKGHSGRVWSVAFSHDSTRLASASDDGTVKIWNASSGKYLRTLKGHSNWDVWSVIFSHDSTRLASAPTGGTIWDVSSGKYLRTLKGHSNWDVRSVTFSHDSTRLASASDNGTVKIWDASSGKCLQTLEGHSGMALGDISFDATGLYLHTKIGTIAINASSASYTTPIVTKLKGPQYQGGGLSSDGAWITYNSKNLVWVPSEYRPSCSAVSRDTIGIGVRSGKVWICHLNLTNSRT